MEWYETYTSSQGLHVFHYEMKPKSQVFFGGSKDKDTAQKFVREEVIRVDSEAIFICKS